MSRKEPANTSTAGQPFFSRLMQATPRTIMTVVLMIATLIRMPLLTRTSLWYDEAASWEQSRGTLAELIAKVAADNYPPLHNLILWLFIHLFGDSERILRLPSLLAGVLAIWLLYRLGEEIAGSATGMCAAALLAISPFHVWYSGEARMYALFCALGLAVMLALVRYLKRPDTAGFIRSAVLGGLFLCTHIYAAFGLAGAATGLAVFAILPASSSALSRKTVFKALAALAVSALLFTPWALVLFGRAETVVYDGFWIAYPSADMLRTMAREIAGNSQIFWLLVALAGIGLLLTLFRRRPSTASPATIKWLLPPLVGFTIAPVLIGYALSITLRPILFDRYLIAAFPGLLLLACLGARSLLPRGGALALIAVVLSLAAAPLDQVVLDKLKPQFREAAFVYFRESQTAVSDGRLQPLYVYNHESALALSYYLEDLTDIRTLDSLKIPRTEDPQQKIWLVASHLNKSEWQGLTSAAPDGYAETFRWQGFGWGAGGITLLRFEDLAPSAAPTHDLSVTSHPAGSNNPPD
ncbi:glycosyltransferase family 39 protein [Roseibium sp. CAU 1637]|uniref:Glycosyltransferase family 39 protein n=1 Tax=Roseibium limicola TaxID=2816037 RepID=A0A939EJD8_9HYPH|nr:glycosyltransferase family 39 protein [Roseibium limicola]MBO0343721.1 glycosyltransferase family 39 protein [Roseibium limicola]